MAPKLIQQIALPFFLPHLLFAHLYSKARSLFDFKMFGHNGDETRLDEFWSEVQRRRDPRLHNHPITKRKNWKRRAIPICIHGDGAPVVAVGKSGTKSLDNISWGSLLACGSILSIKLWITAVFLSLGISFIFVCLFVRLTFQKTMTPHATRLQSYHTNAVRRSILSHTIMETTTIT